MSYAKGTSVSVDRSRQEIERLLTRYNKKPPEKMAFMMSDKTADVVFKIRGLTIRMMIWMPMPEDYQRTPKTNERRTPTAANKHYEDEKRRRWRSLAAVIKAKLIAIDDGVATFEEEFMSYIVTDNGQTLGDRLLPSVHRAIEQKTMLSLPAQLGG